MSGVITSRQNPVIQELKDHRDPAGSDELFLEGLHLLEEALKSNCRIDQLIVIPALMDLDLLKQAAGKTKKIVQVSAYVMKTLSDVEAPQGVIALCRKPTWDWPELVSQSPSPLLIIDGVQDPGNAATILRTAEAAGAAGIITTPGTAHLFSPKALRGAMGSTLRLPILEHRSIEEIAQKLSQAGYSLVVSDGRTGATYTQLDWKKAWAVIVGQEGRGMSDSWRSVCSEYVRIPMKTPVESLNVAAAAAVLLYESARQRRSLISFSTAPEGH